MFLDLSDSAEHLTGNNNVLLWSFATHFVSIRLLNHLNLLSSLLFLSRTNLESATGFPQPPSSEPAAISSLISFILSSYFCCISRAFRSNLNCCKTSKMLLNFYVFIHTRYTNPLLDLVCTKFSAHVAAPESFDPAMVVFHISCSQKVPVWLGLLQLQHPGKILLRLGNATAKEYGRNTQSDDYT